MIFENCTLVTVDKDRRIVTDGALAVEGGVIRAVGAENEGHWAGLIAAPITYVVDRDGKIRWAYVSASAADRPSPVALAKAACAVAAGKEPPANYPGKT